MAWTCPKLDAETWTMVGWIISYCIASSSMTILNKAAIKAFDFPYWLCTFQNLATLLVLAIIVNIVPKNHKIFAPARAVQQPSALHVDAGRAYVLPHACLRHVSHADHVRDDSTRDAVAHAAGHAGARSARSKYARCPSSQSAPAPKLRTLEPRSAIPALLALAALAC